ncbi:MAG TPA: NAD-dependent epimerase/dehydratase family protein, partial [Candidatus Nanopelagicales bacterium]|nr:NAD-dependent epimerase/dehydratase family protein [Candidatus Nanopelagicales bacterium]
MRVLVTGGAGYVGSVSVEALVAAGHDVVVLDDLSRGHREAVAPAARLVAGSYGNAGLVRALLAETPIDAVLHCAARSLVGESVANPALYYRENVAGGVTLLEA